MEVEHRNDPLSEGDMPVIEESLATSNKLSLLQNGMWKGKNKVLQLAEGAHGPYVGNVDKVVCSQFQSKPQIREDAAALVHGETLEVVLQKLGVAINERDVVRM